MTMKLYALFTAQPKHDPKITGEWHYATFAGGGIFVSEPRAPGLYDQAVAHLSALGGTVLPELDSYEPLTASHLAHPVLKGVAIPSGAHTYKATKTMAAHFGWPQLDPRLRRR